MVVRLPHLPRVKTDLVHDGDTGLLGLLVKLHHGGGDIAGGDDVLLLADGRLDDGRVESVGDQADDQIVLGDLGVESGIVGDIERDGGGVLNTGGQLLGRLESSASCIGSGRVSFATPNTQRTMARNV